MFGRIRSCSSLDSLERPPSKILKDDCLSIYETTLMKLKLGSQRNTNPSIMEDALENGEVDSNGEADSNSSSSRIETMNTEACYSPANSPKGSPELANSTKEDLMNLDSDCSITSTITTPDSSEECQSTEDSTQPRMKNSILYLFSKFKNSTGTPIIMEEAMAIEDVCCVVMSPSSSSGQSTDNSELLSKSSSNALLEKVQ